MRSLLIGLLSCFVFSSCIFQKPVFHSILESASDSTVQQSVQIAEPVIQKNDLLSVQIFSAALDPTVDQLYNQPVSQTTGGTSSPTSGYLVDVNGNIELPRIGLVKAEGLKKGELEELVKSKLQGQLTRPSVIVRFMNFRITVLGEVGAPSVITVPTERLTILEAIGMAGGITEYGAIKRVKVLRENNGVREMETLDLTSQDIFKSRFYQLQQNDVVLVDQSEYKMSQTDQARIAQQVGLATSIISVIAVIIALFR